jgi:hypothetical protein
MRVSRAIVWLAVGACTPLGLWMYQDPLVTVARVRVNADQAVAEPIQVALNVLNPNDYPISTARVELSLALDDQAVGRLDRVSSVTVSVGMTATRALPLRPGRKERPPLGRFRSGVHRFLVEGRATFVTPIGTRKIRFAQAGEMAFDSTASPASAPAAPAGSP